MTISAPHPVTQALGLAAQALFLSNPNPRVGCVLRPRQQGRTCAVPTGKTAGQTGYNPDCWGKQPRCFVA